MHYYLSKSNGKWLLREEGSIEAVFAADTKTEALDKLEEHMKTQDGSMSVYTAGGSINEHRNFQGERKHWDVSKWSVIGVVAVAALTAVGVVFYFRDSIPTRAPPPAEIACGCRHDAALLRVRPAATERQLLGKYGSNTSYTGAG